MLLGASRIRICLPAHLPVTIPTDIIDDRLLLVVVDDGCQRVSSAVVIWRKRSASNDHNGNILSEGVSGQSEINSNNSKLKRVSIIMTIKVAG